MSSAGSGRIVIRDSTVTGNAATDSGRQRRRWRDIAAPGRCSILPTPLWPVTGFRGSRCLGPDISGTITLSNGHNIFGSDVLGNVAGDRENIAASAIFAAIDPDTGGGLVNAAGVVPLKANADQPGPGRRRPVRRPCTDQIGSARPQPAGHPPRRRRRRERLRPLQVSSANNDTLTGTAAANTLNGQAGHDLLKGLGGADTLNGGDGGDFLEGGAGNDKLNGNAGIDIANYADLATAVTVDLRGDAAADKDTAKRGTETDTLTGIEGAIGSQRQRPLLGRQRRQLVPGRRRQGHLHRRGGRDLYDYNLASATPVGASRDVITDFDHLTDDIDLMGIDANSTVAGNQAFRWVGTAALTGAGEVGYFTSGGNTIIRMSTDADAASEAEIQLTGIKTLQRALDFLTFRSWFSPMADEATGPAANTPGRDRGLDAGGARGQRLGKVCTWTAQFLRDKMQLFQAQRTCTGVVHRSRCRAAEGSPPCMSSSSAIRCRCACPASACRMLSFRRATWAARAHSDRVDMVDASLCWSRSATKVVTSAWRWQFDDRLVNFGTGRSQPPGLAFWSMSAMTPTPPTHDLRYRYEAILNSPRRADSSRTQEWRSRWRPSDRLILGPRGAI